MHQVRAIQKLRQGLYRLLTGFMVIWLAVFYSALCEYHGLMLPFGPDPMASMHAGRTPAPAAMHIHHPGMAMPTMSMPSLMQDGNEASVFMQFSRVALSTAAMSFLTIATPTSFNLQPVQQQSFFVVVAPSITHQWSLLPPDQPPRLLPLG